MTDSSCQNSLHPTAGLKIGTSRVVRLDVFACLARQRYQHEFFIVMFDNPSVFAKRIGRPRRLVVAGDDQNRETSLCF